MTIRTMLNKKFRTMGILTASGILVFFLGGIYAAWEDFGPPPIISFVGIVVAVIAILFGQSRAKCPNCRNILGYVAMARGFEFGNPFSVSPKFKFCPYCGIDIDSEIEKDKAV